MRIQPIVGSALEMVSQVVSGTTTALNTTLLEDYIQPAMVQWLYYELPMVLAFKYMNKGMVRRTSEESSQMSMDEITRLTDKVKNDAEWYSERITRYLMENRTDYPLFNSPPSALDTIYPNGTNYNTGMALDARTLRRGAGLDRLGLTATTPIALTVEPMGAHAKHPETPKYVLDKNQTSTPCACKCSPAGKLLRDGDSLPSGPTTPSTCEPCRERIVYPLVFADVQSATTDAGTLALTVGVYFSDRVESIATMGGVVSGSPTLGWQDNEDEV